MNAPQGRVWRRSTSTQPSRFARAVPFSSSPHGTPSRVPRSENPGGLDAVSGSAGSTSGLGAPPSKLIARDSKHLCEMVGDLEQVYVALFGGSNVDDRGFPLACPASETCLAARGQSLCCAPLAPDSASTKDVVKVHWGCQGITLSIRPTTSR